MTLAANIVRLIHLALVLFVVVVPLAAGKDTHWSILAVHCMTVVTLLVHWITKQNACFLTLVESTLRGVPNTQSFMYSIVAPVYQIDDAELRDIVQVVTPILGVISAVKLSNKWAEMKEELVKCWKTSRLSSRLEI